MKLFKKISSSILLTVITASLFGQAADVSSDATITGLWTFDNEFHLSDGELGLKKVYPFDYWVQCYKSDIYVRDIHRSFKYGGTLTNPLATPANSYIYSHEWGDSYKWDHGAQTIRIKGSTADGYWQWAIKNGSYGSSNEILAVNNVSGGRVGINQSNPTEALDVNGSIKVSDYLNVGRLGVSGTYDSHQVQGIWSIGTNYKVDVANNNFGNQYGIVYAHTNAGSSSTLDSKKPISGWGHQILFTNSGLTSVAISSTSGRIWAKDFIRSNYFNCEPGDGRGLRFWNSDSYKICMSSYSNGTWGGRLDSESDYNMYFLMSGGTNRGWYFKNKTTGKGVHIVGNGDIIAQGNITSQGLIKATEILVEANGNTADFVFEETYNLRDLSELEAFIKENKHLPEIPSAEAMEAQGVNLAEMNKLLLQKVEELTLYTIEKDKEVKALKAAKNKEQGERAKLESTVLTLSERLAKIEQLLNQ